jgi:hypothetical protein
MKNHLSMLGSMDAACRFSPFGRLRLYGSTRSGDLEMVVLALYPTLAFTYLN